MRKRSNKKIHEKETKYVITEEDTIYVAIASYRDPELCKTITDLIDKAYHKENIYIGVVQQNDYNVDDPDAFAENVSSIFQQQIKIMGLDYRKARGPTWARHLCQSMWKNQKYYLMIDSHMRFEKDWDRYLIEMLQNTPNPHRSIISVYPEGYERNMNHKTNQLEYTIKKRKAFRSSRFKHVNESGIPEFESVSESRTPPSKPVLTTFWAAGFSFSHSDAMVLCPYSPYTPFLYIGEEFFMACRYWTHGFDLYLPCYSVCYHLWERNHRKVFWEIEVIQQRVESEIYVRDMMLGITNDTHYGMGSCRSVQSFWDFAGVDLVNRTLTRPKEIWQPPTSQN